MSKKNTVPQHIQRLHAMEERLRREAREGEIRIQNDLKYAKANIVSLVGSEAASKVSTKNAFLGNVISKIFSPKKSSKSRKSKQSHQYLTKEERLLPSLRKSGTYKLGIKSLLEDFILPVIYGIARGKILVAGIKGTGKLLGTFVRRVRRAL